MQVRQGVLLEEDVKKLFDLIGFKTQREKKIGRHRLDLFIKYRDITIVVECKQYESSTIDVKNLIHLWDSKNTRDIKATKVLLVIYGIKINEQDRRLAKKLGIAIWDHTDFNKFYTKVIREKTNARDFILDKGLNIKKDKSYKENYDLLDSEDELDYDNIPLTEYIKVTHNNKTIASHVNFFSEFHLKEKVNEMKEFSSESNLKENIFKLKEGIRGNFSKAPANNYLKKVWDEYIDPKHYGDISYVCDESEEGIIPILKSDEYEEGVVYMLPQENIKDAIVSTSTSPKEHIKRDVVWLNAKRQVVDIQRVINLNQNWLSNQSICVKPRNPAKYVLILPFGIANGINIRDEIGFIEEKIMKRMENKNYETICPMCKKEFEVEMEEGDNLKEGVNIKCPYCNKWNIIYERDVT